MKFIAFFHYSNRYEDQLWWQTIKAIAEEKLVAAWGRLCDYSNPRLEEWNAEFESYHPGVDEWSEDYTVFMKGKYAPIYDELNAENDISGPLQFSYHVGDELRMIETCRINGAKLFDVYFTLKEVP